MSQEKVKRLIGEVFNDIADAIESGSFGKKVKVALTLPESEHGAGELVKAAKMAMEKYHDFEVVLIGPKIDGDFKIYEAETLEESHKVMEKLLDEGEIDSAVTLHYNFPIGVSTVGRAVTPGSGKEMMLATTTGTSSSDRVEAIFKNALYGIIAAKAMGITEPSVGILNVDGAKQVERALKELSKGGYEINFAGSVRKDGGCVMRGNDLLAGVPDVMVTDTLTGNLLVKILSSYTTGGSYESLGYGYGPGIGEGYNRIICIISRASGAPLIREALRYAATLAQNKLPDAADREFKAAARAGYNDILKRLAATAQGKDTAEEVKAPHKRVVTYSIAGIDILELEDAVKELWKNGIYSESGMGCTGPIVLVPEDEGAKAEDILIKSGYLLR
ncbi:glycine/sarcosine/betaine reductase complex component C subunit alpha [Oxobacter pfennigii]|uniref:Glycine/sarcosine/betaine reductase complex component C subunit alpha n=1 Tax=Oxobacter pfennigii TaxID=36849 RepID=A0A0P8YB82_9CLOT|nr:glycine/sarcosine/betaine reductase complex component C subunit alpha [Oxobacter pfennigii]KPU44303.1 glycine/sarcosine/betaine reductase complex component C subunit alpha [Oxobacter pfennigii]